MTTEQRGLQNLIDIGNNWRPFLEAVGVDTKGWTPDELYMLEGIVSKDPEVFQIERASANGVLLDALAAVRALSPEKKRLLKARVEQARGKK